MLPPSGGRLADHEQRGQAATSRPAYRFVSPHRSADGCGVDAADARGGDESSAGLDGGGRRRRRGPAQPCEREARRADAAETPLPALVLPAAHHDHDHDHHHDHHRDHHDHHHRRRRSHRRHHRDPADETKMLDLTLLLRAADVFLGHCCKPVPSSPDGRPSGRDQSQQQRSSTPPPGAGNPRKTPSRVRMAGLRVRSFLGGFLDVKRYFRQRLHFKRQSSLCRMIAARALHHLSSAVTNGRMTAFASPSATDANDGDDGDDDDGDKDDDGDGDKDDDGDGDGDKDDDGDGDDDDDDRDDENENDDGDGDDVDDDENESAANFAGPPAVPQRCPSTTTAEDPEGSPGKDAEIEDEPTAGLKAVTSALKLLRVFSRLEDVCEVITRQGGVRIIAAAMRLAPRSKEVHTQCSAVLANLCPCDTAEAQIVAEGCVEEMVRGLQRFQDCPTSLCHCVGSLANLSSKDQLSRAILALDGHHVVLQLMRRHRSSAGVLVEALKVLSSLSRHRDHPGLLDPSWTEKVRDAVVASMRLHQENGAVMCAACGALGSVHFGDGGLGCHRPQILGMIFRSLETHRHRITSLIAALFALAHFSFSTAAASEPSRERDGIRLILDAMRTFPDNESLQTTAFFALGSIVSVLDANRDAVCELGGIPVLLKSMSRMRKAARARGNADDDSREVDRAKEPILYARFENGKPRAFSKLLLLQMFGSVVLLNLGENPKCKAEIIKRGGVSHIFEAVRAVSEFADLRFVVVFVFGKFVSNETRSAYLQSASLPSLAELCRRQVADGLSRRGGGGGGGGGEISDVGSPAPSGDGKAGRDEPPSSPERESGGRAAGAEAATRAECPPDLSLIERLPLTPKLKGELTAARWCSECGRSCFESCVTLYDMGSLRGGGNKRFCSAGCASKRPDFGRSFFRCDFP